MGNFFAFFIKKRISVSFTVFLYDSIKSKVMAAFQARAND